MKVNHVTKKVSLFCIVGYNLSEKEGRKEDGTENKDRIYRIDRRI